MKLPLFLFLLVVGISARPLAATETLALGVPEGEVTARTAVTYKVGAGGDFLTIEAALAAATDPAVDKYIVLEPHTYSYPLDRHTRLQLKVPRTHLRGAGPDKTRIIASSGKGLNSWGVVEVRASDCSVEGIWVENRWKKGDPPNKQSALTVGSAEDPKVEPDSMTTVSGVRITNCKMTGTTKDRHSDHLAWDVVTVGANVTSCTFERCEMRGFADVFSSWAQRVDVNDCIIDAKGWNAIWVAGGSADLGFNQESVAVFRNCRLGSSHYYVAGGAGPKNFAMPVVYLRDCRPYPEGAEPVEAARMQLLSHAIAIVVRNTPFLPYLAVKGGPKGNPPSVVLPDVVFKENMLNLFREDSSLSR
jgi:hypothetical protein